MGEAPASVQHKRRTQAERTAATRAALLEATVECLVESGYASVTTREIADRAGVTRGAQAHHFSSRAELVIEAVRYLAATLVVEFVAPLEIADDEPTAMVEVIDRLWDMHRSDIFTAAIELWLAARTDAELRAHLTTLEADILSAVGNACDRTLPRLSALPSTLGLLATTLATMRGLALLTFVHDDVSRSWASARESLLALWRQQWELVAGAPEA